MKADLLDASCWPDIVKGCDYVCHLASPFPASTPKDENEIIKPAVEVCLRCHLHCKRGLSLSLPGFFGFVWCLFCLQGTVNVLKACAQTPTVRRVVLTASVVSGTSTMCGVGHRSQCSVF